MINKPLFRLLLFAAVTTCLILTAAQSRAAGPVVPGYEKLKASGKATPAELGELLLGELNCAACHKADGTRIGSKQAPNLSNAGSRLTPQYIRAFLSDPAKVKPGTMMPTIFHTSEAKAKAGAVEALTHFLVSQGGPIKPAKVGGSKAMAGQGKALFESVGCVACHTPEGKTGGIPLNHMGSNTTVDQLSAFLQDPHATRPAGRMPNLHLKKGEADAISVYLLRAQLDNPQNKDAAPASKPGVSYKYYQGAYIDKEDSLAKATPKAKGETPGFSLKPAKSKNNYALVFEGSINAPATGKYEFHCASDDSSFLWIDGKKIVSNPGAHGEENRKGSVQLTEGPHTIKVIFTQEGGGAVLKVRWKTPGGKLQAIPTNALSTAGGAPMVPLKSESFTVSAQQVKLGAMMFSMMGCASCHTQTKGGPVPPFVAARNKNRPALAALNSAAATGCLSAKVPKGRPHFNLDAAQKTAIRAALAAKAELAKPRTAQKQILHKMASLGCINCHERDGIGGPSDESNAYFKQAIAAELGDEGRIPPTLSGVGSKLKPEALKGIVQLGKYHVRPYMATRMPQFTPAATDDLIATVLKLDAKEGEAAAPEFTKTSMRDGRKLVGTTGLGCINCHNLAGNQSLGVPAVDLASTHARLNPGWFRRYLNKPIAINKGTRMPALWPNGIVARKDIAGGKVVAQQNAIWNYLSLGDSIPLPAGMGAKTDGKLLVPGGEPVVLRTFIAGAGPRGIAIGFPERIHVSFDANVMRLVNAWKGDFIDPHGAWSGRNMKFNGPAGTKIILMPAGPSFAKLPSASTPWPNPDPKTARNVGGKFKGYKLDKDRAPIFMYVLDGVRIEEQPLPNVAPGGASLLRLFNLSATNAPSDLVLLAAEGTKITPGVKGTYDVDGTLTVIIRADGMKPTIRTIGGKAQLLIPVKFKAAKAAIEVELKW